jgi:hypothetical protein
MILYPALYEICTLSLSLQKEFVQAVNRAVVDNLYPMVDCVFSLDRAGERYSAGQVQYAVNFQSSPEGADNQEDVRYIGFLHRLSHIQCSFSNADIIHKRILFVVFGINNDAQCPLHLFVNALEIIKIPALCEFFKRNI